MNDPILIVLLSVLTLAVFLPRREISGRTVHLFRALLPSWRFFDEESPVPILSCRVELSPGEFSPWREIVLKSERRWHHLFFNPEGSLTLAAQSLLQRLARDIEDGIGTSESEIERNVSFRLVRNLAQYSVEREWAHSGAISPEGIRFQFKLSYPLPGPDRSAVEDQLISGVYSR